MWRGGTRAKCASASPTRPSRWASSRGARCDTILHGVTKPEEWVLLPLPSRLLLLQHAESVPSLCRFAWTTLVWVERTTKRVQAAVLAAVRGSLAAQCLSSVGGTRLPCCLPRWEANSYGYYGADGKKLHASPEAGEAYGPSFRAGDVVGAGLHIQRQEIFFT